MSSPPSPPSNGRSAAGVAGLAGDLCIDGAIGSRTAALSVPYADAETCGARYLSERQITDHVIACTRAGLQAGFHCIGDDAVAAAVAGCAGPLKLSAWRAFARQDIASSTWK